MAIDGGVRARHLPNRRRQIVEAIEILDRYLASTSSQESVALSADVSEAFSTHFFLRPSDPKPYYGRVRDELWQRLVTSIDDWQPFGDDLKPAFAAKDKDKVLNLLEFMSVFDRTAAFIDFVSQAAALINPAGDTEEDQIRHERLVYLQQVAAGSNIELTKTVRPKLTELKPVFTVEDIAGRAIAISNSGELVLYRMGANDRVYRVPEPEPIAEFQATGGNTSMFPRSFGFFTADGSTFVAAAVSDTVRLLDTSNWSVRRDVAPHANAGIEYLTMIDDRTFVVGQGGMLRFFNDKGDLLRSSRGISLLTPGQSLDGALLGIGGSLFGIEGPKTIISAPDNKQLTFVPGKFISGRRSVLEPERFDYLLSTQDGAIEVLPLRTALPRQTVKVVAPRISLSPFLAPHLAISPDGSRLAIVRGIPKNALEYSVFLTLLKMPDLKEIISFPLVDIGAVNDLVFSTSGAICVVDHKGVTILDPATENGQRFKLGGEKAISLHAFSTNGRFIAVAIGPSVSSLEPGQRATVHVLDTRGPASD